MPRKSIAEMEREMDAAHERISARIAEMQASLEDATRKLYHAELRAERAEAQRESAERLLETVVQRLFPNGMSAFGPPGSGAPTIVTTTAGAAPAEPSAVTAKVRAVCRRYSDNSQRQYSINLQKAQDWAAEGLTEEQIIARLHRGEAVSA